MTGIEKYLGSGLIKGVGPVTAKRIVKHFGLDTLEIIETQIDRLIEVPGIAKKRVKMIQTAWETQKAIKEVMIFLQAALHNRGMKCIHCASTSISKNGHRRGKQCFICRTCGRQFLEDYDTLGYRDDIKQHCLELYVNGMGFRAIERITGVNHNTVINWVKRAGASLPEYPFRGGQEASIIWC